MNKIYTLVMILLISGIGVSQDQVLFDEIRLTETIDDYGLTGAGTIVAILDRGIDYEHEDFINDDGTSRILYIWDLSDDSGSGAADNPYGKGTFYNQSQINNALSFGNRLATRDASGHGTVTAGVTAGDGSGSGGRIKGIAPEADIIVIKITSEGAPAINGEPSEASFSRINDSLEDAIDFIKQVAEDEKKPVSMIANFGSIQGPQDGTSTIARMLDTKVGPGIEGVAFICGSSDDGGVANHAGGNFSQGETTEIRIKKATTNLRFDMWYAAADDISIEVVTPDGTFGPYRTLTSQADGYNESTSAFGLFHRGADIDFFGSTSDRRELLIDFRGSIGEVTVKITGDKISNGRFDAIINQAWILGADNRFLNNIEEGGTIWDLASAKNNICPNSYIVRTTWENYQGGTFDFPGDENGVGSLWTGSGIGPTQDGRIGIDVSVPGNMNIGAYAPRSNFGSVLGNVIINDSRNMYGMIGAVSGANPVMAGVVALMFEADPTLTATEIKTILRETARMDSNTGSVPNNSWGYGKLDVRAAIEAILGPPSSVYDNISEEISVYPVPVTDGIVHLTLPDAISEWHLRVYNLQGQVIYSSQERNTRATINLSNEKRGTYFIEGRNDVSIFQKKIVLLNK